MMWNQNDTKYIIKRLILYIAISCIVFFGASKCAKASVYSVPVTNGSQNKCQGTSTTYTWDFGSPNFVNVGQGYVIFNVISQSSGSGQSIVQSVNLVSIYNSYNCELSGDINYYDNTTMQHVITAKCPIQGANENLSIYIEKSGSEGTCIKIGGPATFVSELNNANQIVNGINSALQQQINDNNTNAIATQDVIRNATAQEIAAINSATQATQDNTAAINAQTQWQQQNFNVDTTQIDAITDLISTGDKNKIRDLMMFPARILMLIGAHIGSDYCTAYNLGSLYGTNLILPCINWKNYVGATLYNTIDTIVSIGIYIGLIIYVRKLLDYAFSLGATTFESVNVEVFN